MASVIQEGLELEGRPVGSAGMSDAEFSARLAAKVGREPVEAIGAPTQSAERQAHANGDEIKAFLIRGFCTRKSGSTPVTRPPASVIR